MSTVIDFILSICYFIYMERYFITTDQTADFPLSLYEDDFGILQMSYTLDGVLYDGVTRPFLSTKDFYDKLSEGKTASTSMPSVSESEKFFSDILERGFDVLHISFSSALSGAYNSYCTAAQEVLKSYPERKITIIDSLCAACGEGLLVYYALKKRREGATLEENAEYISDLRNHIGHSFTVDDMMHLYRGGRVAKTTAVVGQALKMKPVLMVSDKGELIPTNTVMGRRPALKTLVDKMEAKGKGYNNDVIFIGNCDAREDAEILKRMVEDRFGAQNVLIADISPIVGSHLGKGGITLHYLCSDKIPFIR